MSTILVVEDDFDLSEIVSDLLREEGYCVKNAYTGAEGLAILRSQKLPNLILMDVDMPVMNGIGMAHEMVVHDAGEEMIPIILCSSRVDLKALAAKIGTPYYMAKPFDISSLLTKVIFVLNEHRKPHAA
jgi:DNA-binding response OmpR family regulator